MSSKQKYNPNEIEPKWQKIWDEAKVYSPNLDTAKKPFYNLMMFPYPSAEGMHVGNMYAFTGADVYGRFMRMQGNDVFEPMGLDGFGIHSENYAIKVGRHPKEQAKISEKNFYRQLRAIGNGFDWSRKVETYDPKYYKWTQWLFIQLFKAGLAYRRKAAVNFCPKDLTVLADEQVIDGKCERCETEVIKKELEQWFFRITKYADRLLNNIEKLDWSEKVKIAQRQWIGRSEGAQIEFKVQSSKFKVQVFTTRPDTLYGATFLVLSPEHPIINVILNSFQNLGSNGIPKQVRDDILEYVENAKKKTEQERMAEGKEKTGVFSGIYAINPLNQEKVPVWIADYALMGYGTGALFGDAHDERDVKFAKKYKIPLKVTVITGDKEKDERIKNFEECFTGYGILIDSGEFSGLTSEDAKKKITAWLKDHNYGGTEITYHLRDWLISRQRYWGPPIPMIFCKKCNWQPVPEIDLPVLLPDVKDWKPKGIHSTSSGQAGKSPLASAESFVNTACPNCQGAAKRETDVSDTFLDSAWYFLRYVSTDIESVAFDIERVKKWLPVTMYIGGAEHSVLHLLYSRFITMVLKDLGLIEFEEPFSRFYAHGLLVKEGAKMSKSKGNVVIPDEYISKYGADTLRMYLMFLGPFNQGGDFYDTGIEGMFRFLKRVWTLVHDKKDSMKTRNDSSSLLGSNEAYVFMNKTIKRVKDDMENLRYNTAIAALMEYYNFLSKQEYIAIEEFRNLLKLLSPFAPHIVEELWEYIGGKFSIHQELFPKFNQNALKSFHRTIAIQINGKLRDTVIVTDQASKNKNTIEQLARKSDKVIKYLEGKTINKVVYVEGKIINFVIDDR